MTCIFLDGAERPFGAEITAAFAADGDTVITEMTASASIDVLVINVPVTLDGARFLEIDDAALAAALELLFFGVVATVQGALPCMEPGGRIVVVAARGHLGAWGGAHLMAANAALMGLVRSMALEFSDRGIRVNALAPDFAAERWDTPAARVEVAQAVLFLARAGMSLLTGQTLLLDGARSLRMVEARKR